MSHDVFGTAINCIDGRVQLPVIQWMKEHYPLDHVDMVTEPGADKVVAAGTPAQIEIIKAKVCISVQAHGSKVVAVAGHDECAGNPVPKEVHWEQIRQAVQVVHSWDLPVRVVGLWLGDTWSVEVVEP